MSATVSPTDLITVAQASRLRAELGSPLSRNAIYGAIAAERLTRYSLPSHDNTALVSRAEIEAYRPIGHKPTGYRLQAEGAEAE